MKKNFLRIFATASAVVALVFVIVLLIAAFGGIEEAQFENGLVQGLFIALAIAFLLLTAATLAMLFMNDDAAKEIVLRSDKDGATRTTVSVVKKIAKETVALVEGVKCSKCAIVNNEYGVRLKITVKVKDVDVDDAEKYVRACLEDAFLGKLNFKFYSIEIKVNKLKSKYEVNAEKIKREIDAQKPAEILAQEEAILDEEVKAAAEQEVLAAIGDEEPLPEQEEENPIDPIGNGEIVTATEQEPSTHVEPLDPTTFDSPVE